MEHPHLTAAGLRRPHQPTAVRAQSDRTEIIADSCWGRTVLGPNPGPSCLSQEDAGGHFVLVYLLNPRLLQPVSACHVSEAAALAWFHWPLLACCNLNPPAHKPALLTAT